VELDIKLAGHHTIKELKQFFHTEKNKIVSDRILIILLSKQETSETTIAEMIGFCRQTVRSWKHRYNENGISGLSDLPRSGRPSNLDIEEQCLLKKK